MRNLLHLGIAQRACHYARFARFVIPTNFNTPYNFANRAGCEIEFGCGLIDNPGDQFIDRSVRVLTALNEETAIDFLKHLAFVVSHTGERFAFEHSANNNGCSFFADPEARGGRMGDTLKDVGEDDVVGQRKLLAERPHKIGVTLLSKSHYAFKALQEEISVSG